MLHLTIQCIEDNSPNDYLIIILEIEKKHNSNNNYNPPREPRYRKKHYNRRRYSIENIHINFSQLQPIVIEIYSQVH